VPNYQTCTCSRALTPGPTCWPVSLTCFNCVCVCVSVCVSQKHGFGDGNVRVIDSCRAPCSQSYYSYLISSVQQPLLSLPQRAPAHGPGVLSARCSIILETVVRVRPRMTYYSTSVEGRILNWSQ